MTSGACGTDLTEQYDRTETAKEKKREREKKKSDGNDRGETKEQCSSSVGGTERMRFFGCQRRVGIPLGQPRSLASDAA